MGWGWLPPPLSGALTKAPAGLTLEVEAQMHHTQACNSWLFDGSKVPLGPGAPSLSALP